MTPEQRRESIYKLINSALSGGLVFFGTFVGADFRFTWTGIGVSLATSILVALTKFKEYWDGEAGEYSTRLFNIINA